jgi:formamidopyrimidine-DNA glycosylase
VFELPEYLTLSRQIDETLHGCQIQNGSLGNSPHKFVWYNRSHDEFTALTRDKLVGSTRVRGRWLSILLDPGYVIVLGECGGKILYHQPGSSLPSKYHLLITFTDGSAFSVTTTMWGAMELYQAGDELERQYIKDMRPTPIDPAFTWEYFDRFLDELIPLEKRSVKSLLTQDQLIPGLGNAIAQDILFRSGLHPRHLLQELTLPQRRLLFNSINETVAQVARLGGRSDETDLFGRPGGYIRLMDRNALQRPCPVCAGEVEKIQYLGGACYLCPCCQE